MAADYPAWENFICEQFDDIEIQCRLKSYVARLLTQQAVVIFEIEHLAKLLGIRPRILNRMIAKPAAFYYRFTIPKRSGGFRTISAPYPVLLSAQRWIYKHILSRQSIHTKAYGFVKHKTIVTMLRFM